MIDLHAHVLPGVDDGPATLADAVELVRAAAADGIERVAATPHVRDDYPTAPEAMERLVAEVRSAVAQAGVRVEVLTGGELDVEYLQRFDDATLGRFGLGGNQRLLLVETPYVGWPLGLGDALFRLAARGFSVLLAHPERNPEVQERPELLRPLVDAGVLVQLTGASLDGRLGERPRRSARALLEGSCAHVLASDAHGPHIRAAGLSAAAAAVGDCDLARWLTRDVPAALLAGEAPPPRPERRRLVAWRRSRAH